MDCLYKDNIETLQSKIPCFVWAKHIHRAQKEDVELSIYWTFGHLPSHSDVDISHIHPLKVNHPAMMMNYKSYTTKKVV
jgi:hypothetical protein